MVVTMVISQSINGKIQNIPTMRIYTMIYTMFYVHAARKIRHVDKPFGGLQLVLCGDFFQLPPIPKVGETSVK
jgi:hypothetical protein